MDERQKYSINMGAQFDFLNLINVNELIDNCTEKWFNQTLCKVNGCLVRLGVFNEGDFHWHKHDNEDEMFFVLKGQLHIDLEGRSVVLKAHEGFAVPKGVMHKTYVKEPTAVLMIEGDSVTPTGD